MEELGEFKVPYNKEKMEMYLLLALLIALFVLCLYALILQNKYNGVVVALNNCTKSCLPIEGLRWT